MAETKIKNQKSKIEKKDGETKTVKSTKVSIAKKEVNKQKEIKKVTVEQTSPVVTEKKTKKETLHLDVYDLTGKVSGTVAMPAEIFAAKINPELMAQAVRVYLMNQRQGTVSTKTRGEVTGSTRKIYRQKGTGRARHGGIRAPIFVKGGVAHGPKPQDHSLSLPKKMKRAALLSALTSRMKSDGITVVDGLGSIEMKTKVVAAAFKQLHLRNKVLLVMPAHLEIVYKAARNIDRVDITSAQQLTTYDVLQHKTLLFMKEAIDATEKTFGKKPAAK